MNLKVDDIKNLYKNHLPEFICQDHSRELCNQIINEIIWSEITLNINYLFSNHICSYNYCYGSNEEYYTPKESLDKLSDIVETVLETKVKKIWLWIYKNGHSHKCSQNLFPGEHLLNIFFGTKRKFYIKNKDKKSFLRMRNCDALYIPKKLNDDSTMFSVPTNKNINALSIHLCFIIEKPYLLREYELVNIKIPNYSEYLEAAIKSNALFNNSREIIDTITDAIKNDKPDKHKYIKILNRTNYYILNRLNNFLENGDYSLYENQVDEYESYSSYDSYQYNNY